MRHKKITTILFSTIYLLTSLGDVVFADPAGSETIEGTVSIGYIENFKNNTAQKFYEVDVLEKGVRQVKRLGLKRRWGKEFKRNERIRVHGKRGAGNRFDVVDDNPQSIERLDQPKGYGAQAQDSTYEVLQPLINPPAPIGGGFGASSQPPVIAFGPPGIPQLHSNIAATKRIYLEFGGAPAMTWGSYSVPITPPFDTDGDPSSFSLAERDQMREVWERVAEMYSPFNIDVTTVDPVVYTPGETLRILIGGDGAFLGVPGVGGVGYVGGFVSGFSNRNTVLVFQLVYGSQIKKIAIAGGHEAGHALGLQHQSSYSGTTKTEEYSTNGGNAFVAPLMGICYFTERGLWWNGPNSNGWNVIQDDLSIISDNNNAFGYRPDDHGNTMGTSSALTIAGVNASASGVNEQTSDVDVFSFTTTGGTVSFNIFGGLGTMLDVRARIFNTNGTITSADNASLSETLSANVAAGTYYLEVGSHGSYGDVGQYQVTGTVPNSGADVLPPTVSITAPADNATVSGNSVTISANASDNVAVGRVDFYVDGNLVGTDNSSPFSATWDTLLVANGVHTLTATAYDTSLNSGASAPVSVTVANTDVIPPTVSITSPSNGTTVTGTLAIAADAADDTAVTLVELYLDGALIGTDATIPYTFNWDSLTVSNGSHALTAKALDAVGNQTTSAAVSVNVNNQLEPAHRVQGGRYRDQVIDFNRGDAVSDTGIFCNSKVYNRFGQIVSQPSHISSSRLWDGLIDGARAPAGVYKLYGECDDGTVGKSAYIVIK